MGLLLLNPSKNQGISQLIQCNRKAILPRKTQNTRRKAFLYFKIFAPFASFVATMFI